MPAPVLPKLNLPDAAAQARAASPQGLPQRRSVPGAAGASATGMYPAPTASSPNTPRVASGIITKHERAEQIRASVQEIANQPTVARSGALTELVSFLQDRDRDVRQLAAETLALLASHPSNRIVMRSQPDLVNVVVQLIKSSAAQNRASPSAADQVMHRMCSHIVRKLGLVVHYYTTDGTAASTTTPAHLIQMNPDGSRNARVWLPELDSMFELTLMPTRASHSSDTNHSKSASSLNMTRTFDVLGQTSANGTMTMHNTVGPHHHNHHHHRQPDSPNSNGGAAGAAAGNINSNNGATATGNSSGTAITSPHTPLHDHPEIAVAASIISIDMRAKSFRRILRFCLAALAVIDCLLVLVFFVLDRPPAATDFIDQTANRLALAKTTASSDTRILLAEGITQLLISVVAMFIFLLQYASRNAGVLTEYGGEGLPANASLRNSALTTQQYLEMLLWLIHCPVGVALISEDFRYVNGVCVFRLYAVVRAAMEVSLLHTAMVRIMSNFFGLRLDGPVFIRWALQFHKWKLLIPGILLVWSFMALCASFAEGWTFGTSLWFMMVTMTTTGYGDITPQSSAGRVVATCAMALGLVIDAYIVTQVHFQVTRPLHEQKVMDALTLSKLRVEAKRTAARVFLYHYRARIMERKRQLSIEGREALRKRVATESRRLTKQVDEIRLLPPIVDARDAMDIILNEAVTALRAEIDSQSKSITELVSIIQTMRQEAKASAAALAARAAAAAATVGHCPCCCERGRCDGGARGIVAAAAGAGSGGAAASGNTPRSRQHERLVSYTFGSLRDGGASLSGMSPPHESEFAVAAAMLPASSAPSW